MILSYIVIAIILTVALRKIWKRIEQFDNRLIDLENDIFNLKKNLKTSDNKDIESAPSSSRQNLQASANIGQTKIDSIKQTSGIKSITAAQTSFRKAKDRKSKSLLFESIEKQFMENWTGILGTVIFVIGIAFLGVYSAINLSKMFRFFLIVSVSVVLLGCFLYLRRNEKWLKLALWLRSASGAIFLFACLGAGGIPGLNWIHNPLYALCILLLGIFINLFLAYAGGKQYFASLHVLLSLIALSIAPQNQTTFVIAAIITLFGILLTYREKWDYHLLVTISSFFCYHLFWFFKISETALVRQDHYIGIGTTIIISMAAVIVHYRKIYSGAKFELLPCTVHLINWLYFGIGLLLHDTNFKWKTIPILLGAIAAYFLAGRAKKMNIRWLYFLDTLVAQVILLIGIMSLYSWNIDIVIIISLIFIETLLFSKLMVLEKEIVLYRISLAFIYIASVMLIIASFRYYHINEINILAEHGIILVICSLATLFFHISLKKNSNGNFLFFDSITTNLLQAKHGIECSGTGILAGILMLCSYVQFYSISYSSYIISALTCCLIMVRSRYSTLGLSIGTLVLILGTYLINWFQLSEFARYAPITVLLRGMPLYLISLMAVKWAYLPFKNKQMKWIGIYLFMIHTMVLTYFMFNSISNLIPGIVWLLISLPVLEMSKWLSKKYNDNTESIGFPDLYLLHTGYILVGAFLFRHLLVHLQSEEYLGIIKIRLLIEVLALTVFGYWFFSIRPDKTKTYKSLLYIHPLFLELILLFFVLTVGIEVDATWQPIVFISAAFILFLIGKIRNPDVSRLAVYSMMFYYVSIIQVAFIKSTYDKIAINWLEISWISGWIATILQILFLIFFYKYGFIKENCFPVALKALSSKVPWINKNRNKLIFYPLFIGIAVFLYYSFDKSILTLLWVIECFIFFIISIFLKEKTFRYTSLIALVCCIIRLLFYDFSQSSTLMRAVVFLCVGLLMLGMHSLYIKYKDRFSE